jgi:serine/threonine protein kinase
MTPQPEGHLSGRFQLVEFLGQGAFAEVLVARDHQRQDKDAMVALKVLKSDALSNATVIHRFKDEARMLAALRHPAVVNVHELLDYDGRPVMVMEFIPGATLEELCLAGRRHVPTRCLLEVGRRVALALHDAHHGKHGPDGEPMRIIHRDVKPANIMLDKEGVPRLLDFGIAKGDFHDRRARSMYTVAGSAGFESPERRGTGLDSPSEDVYALAVTMFVSITRKPLLLPTSREAHEAAAKEALPHLTPHDLIDASSLQGVLADMLSFDPEQRPSMHEVAVRLEQMLARLGMDFENGLKQLKPLVGDIVASRTRRPMSEIDSFEDLRFLETVSPSEPPEPMSETDTRVWVEHFLSQEGWEMRVHQLQRTMDASPGFREEPFLSILARARPARWRMWVVPARPTEIAATLLILCDHVSSRVIQYATRLENHPDQRVNMAATYLLEQHRA